jgi:hypothetical protein
VGNWIRALNDNYNRCKIAKPLIFEIDYGTKVSSIARVVAPRGKPELMVRLSSGQSKDFGAVIWAAGFGAEDRYSPSRARPTFEGPPFWGPDSLAGCLLQQSPSKASVLISGGGDGALQDYIRVLVPAHIGYARDLLKLCNIPIDLIHPIMSAEDRSHRGRSWADHPSHERPYIEELEKIHKAAVDVALGQQKIEDSVRAIINVDALAELRMVYKGPRLTPYYGLNRFLVMLFAEFMSRSGKVTLFPETWIRSISPTSNNHQCLDTTGVRANGDYKDGILTRHECFRKDHDVELEDTSGKIDSLKCNIIVIRHGTLPNSSQLVPGQLSRTRHMLPYHLPA